MEITFWGFFLWQLPPLPCKCVYNAVHELGVGLDTVFET